MKILEISKPRKHLCQVLFDTGEVVSLYADYVEEISLSAGAELDEDDLFEIITESERKRAFSRAVYYLADGDYSEKGMVMKLKGAKFSDDAADFAAARLKELGYINDERYAAYLAERYNESLISHREAVYKMGQKGLSRETIRAAFEIYDGDETEKISELISRRYADKIGTDEGAKKVFAALMRKGFNASDIRSAFKNFSSFEEYN